VAEKKHNVSKLPITGEKLLNLPKVVAIYGLNASGNQRLSERRHVDVSFVFSIHLKINF
jgi:hypothetical protein